MLVIVLVVVETAVAAVLAVMVVHGRCQRRYGRRLFADAEPFGSRLINARLPRRKSVKRRRGRFTFVVVILGHAARQAARNRRRLARRHSCC